MPSDERRKLLSQIANQLVHRSPKRLLVSCLTDRRNVAVRQTLLGYAISVGRGARFQYRAATSSVWRQLCLGSPLGTVHYSTVPDRTASQSLPSPNVMQHNSCVAHTAQTSCTFSLRHKLGAVCRAPVTAVHFGTVRSRTAKAVPVPAWTEPYDSSRSRLPQFLDNRHLKVVRLSAGRTGSMKNPNDPIGNQTRDIPPC